MKKHFYYFLILLFLACDKSTQEDKNVREPTSVKTHITEVSEDKKKKNELIKPIEHGSFVLQLNNKKIYVDPMGNSMIYAEEKPADIIVVTHYHPDYLVPGAIESLLDKNTKVIVPASVQKILPVDLKEKAQVLKPDQEITIADIKFKSLGFSAENKPDVQENGFLISDQNQKILITGENQFLSEIPMIKYLDILLFRMNLENQGDLNKNIEELLKLNPKQIYPYYYEGIFTYNYAAKLKRRIEEKNSTIEVKVLNWYKDRLH